MVASSTVPVKVLYTKLQQKYLVLKAVMAGHTGIAISRDLLNQ